MAVNVCDLQYRTAFSNEVESLGRELVVFCLITFCHINVFEGKSVIKFRIKVCCGLSIIALNCPRFLALNSLTCLGFAPLRSSKVNFRNFRYGT